VNFTLLDFAKAVRLSLEKEQQKLNPDNQLINTLCNAARIGWEFGKSEE